jgi:hypothetical protein
MLRKRARLRVVALGALGALSLLLLALLALHSWRFAAREARRPPAQDAVNPLPERETALPGRAAARAIVPELPIRLLGPPLPATPASAATFEGRVASAATGAGVPGAELTFSRSGEATSVRAAADGAFYFEPRLSGRWTLAAASAPGFLPFAPEWGHSPVLLDAREGAHVRGITILLAPAVEYQGRVSDPDGHPIADADVRIVGAAAGETALLPLKERFTSDAQGEFRFAAPERAVLEARHAGYDPGTATVDFPVRASRRLTITLVPSAGAARPELSIAGRVDDPNGSPLDGALVVARIQGGDDPARQATTDLTGKFSVSGLAPGSYRLTATRPGFAPALQRGVRAGEADVVLQMRMGGRLSGSVRNRRTGEPVAPFTVAVRSRGRERRGPLRTLAVVDAGGRYEMDDLAPGPAVVVVAAPGHAPSGEMEVIIPDPGAAPATADFDLTSGGRIKGLVLDARTRQPVPGAEIEVEGEVDFGPSALPVRALAIAGADGLFELGGVPPGPNSLYASAEGHHARILSGLDVREGESRGPVTIELTPLAAGEDPKLELTGIGAVLAPRRESLVIVSVLPMGGATEAGLAPGDEVLRIDGTLVTDMDFVAAVNLIRGTENSAVVLGVRKRSDPQHAELRVVVYRRLVRN